MNNRIAQVIALFLLLALCMMVTSATLVGASPDKMQPVHVNGIRRYHEGNQGLIYLDIGNEDGPLMVAVIQHSPTLESPTVHVAAPGLLIDARQWDVAEGFAKSMWLLLRSNGTEVSLFPVTGAYDHPLDVYEDIKLNIELNMHEMNWVMLPIIMR